MAKITNSPVEAYIARQPPEVQVSLVRVREIIRKVLPKAEEVISYQIPAYKVDGSPVVYFAGWKRHWSLYPVTEAARTALGSALDGYDISKGTVRFSLTDPVPARLVARIVKALAKAAADRRRARGTAGRREHAQRRKAPGSGAHPDGSPEVQLTRFVEKFNPKHQALIRAVRKSLRRRLPTATELAYDNYNFFVIGYSPTERPSDAIVSLTAGANGVGLCFINGARLPDPERILLGAGKQTRFIRLESAEVLARPEVDSLLAAAIAHSKTPFQASARRKLLIRSVSAKQRPRRAPGRPRVKARKRRA